jgi:hypothetical protein
MQDNFMTRNDTAAAFFRQGSKLTVIDANIDYGAALGADEMLVSDDACITVKTFRGIAAGNSPELSLFFKQTEIPVNGA